tara:strand:+ start:522 stop:854 length:333 start_codon:yes stop_codon:yes gene_type:complete
MTYILHCAFVKMDDLDDFTFDASSIDMITPNQRGHRGREDARHRNLILQAEADVRAAQAAAQAANQRLQEAARVLASMRGSGNGRNMGNMLRAGFHQKGLSRNFSQPMFS